MAEVDESVEREEEGEGQQQPQPGEELEPIPGTGSSDVASKIPQIIGASVAMLGGFTLGMAIGWTSSAAYINKNSDNTQADITHHQSYIGGLMPVGAMIVMFPMSVVLDRFGRKMTMLLVAPLCATSFLLPGIFHNYICWMIMRILMGFSCAAFCVAAPIYVGEIAEKNIRGALGTMFQLFLTIGILYVYCLGHVNNILWFGILTTIPPCIFFALFMFFPETPLFLMRVDKEDAAIKSLQWYRGKKYNITEEFYETKANCEELKNIHATPKDLVATKSARKSLLISLGLMLFQQLSGINVVMFYASAVFESTGASLNPITCSIILGSVQIVATLATTLLVDRLGRKLLLYLSLTGMAICLFALGIWLIYIGDSKPSSTLGILPLLIINLYLVFFSLGAGPIPWLMVGELFPKEIKGMSGSLSAFFNWILAFCVTVSFQPIQESIGLPPPFFIYAIICTLGNAFLFFYAIETKGKTLEEIQSELEGS